MKIANWIYFIIYITLLCMVALFNRIVDPYDIFNKSAINLNPDFIDNPCTQIKLSKNKKTSEVLIGGSEAKYLNIQKYNKNIADISTYYATINEIENILKFYLDYHPEVKKVYFLVEFKIFDKRKNDPITPKKYLTLKEIYKIFLSIDTTKKSINKIKNNKQTSLAKIDNTIPNNKEANKINPLIKNKDNSTYSKDAILNLSKIFKLLKEKNIEIICLIPPTHANYQLRMHKNFKNQKDEIIKYIAQNASCLINMEFINTMSTTPIKNSNEYFFDEIHVNNKHTKLIYDALISPKESDFSLILTKDNIDSFLEKHNKNIEEYEQSHKTDYEEYIAREKARLPKN